MEGSIAAPRLAALVDDFDRSPAYAGLADALRLLIGDGRVGARPAAAQRARPQRRPRRLAHDRHPRVRRPGRERVRPGPPGIRHLHPAARAAAGAASTAPSRRPRPATTSIDLNCAAHSALPGVGTAYAEAVQEPPALPRRPRLLPHRSARAPGGRRGVVRRARAAHRPRRRSWWCPGALSALDRRGAGAGPPRATACSSRRRATPTRTRPCAAPGARRIGAARWTSDGWDLDAVGRLVRQTRPRLAYLIPDFQNPTGNLMSNAEREQLRRAAPAVGHRSASSTSRTSRLALDGRPMPRPFAGVRPRDGDPRQRQQELLGRPADRLGALSRRRARAADGRPGRARPRQSRCSSSWSRPGCSPAATSCGRTTAQRLREQRDALAAALRDASSPTGGSGCRAAAVAVVRAPARPRGSARARPPSSPEAERRGVAGVSRVRLRRRRRPRLVRPDPFTRPADELRAAVDRLARGVVGRQRARHERHVTRWYDAHPRHGRLSAPRHAQTRSTAAQRGRVDRGLDLGERLGRDRGVDRQRDQRLAALGVAGDLHAGDVDAGVAEDAADGADHARPVARR